ASLRRIVLASMTKFGGFTAIETSLRPWSLAFFGSLPHCTSLPSFVPSPSVSASSGLVPYRSTSSPSERPSPSVSALRGYVCLPKGAVIMNDRIVIDPTIQHGKPVIRGTRVPVVRILGGLAGGMSIDEVITVTELCTPCA